MNAAPSLRFVLAHIGIGLALSGVLMAVILWADPLGLGRLLLQSPDHPVPVLLLGLFCALTLSSVQLGVAIMLRFRR